MRLWPPGPQDRNSTGIDGNGTSAVSWGASVASSSVPRSVRTLTRPRGEGGNFCGQQGMCGCVEDRPGELPIRPCLLALATLGPFVEWYAIAVIGSITCGKNSDDPLFMSFPVDPGAVGLGQPLLATAGSRSASLAACRLLGGICFGSFADTEHGGITMTLKLSTALLCTLLLLVASLPVDFKVIEMFELALVTVGGAQLAAATLLILDNSSSRWKGVCSGTIFALASCGAMLGDAVMAVFLASSESQGGSDVNIAWRQNQMKVALMGAGFVGLAFLTLQIGLLRGITSDSLEEEQHRRDTSSPSNLLNSAGLFASAVLTVSTWIFVPAAAATAKSFQIVYLCSKQAVTTQADPVCHRSEVGLELEVAGRANLAVFLVVTGLVADTFGIPMMLVIGNASCLFWPVLLSVEFRESFAVTGAFIRVLLNVSTALLGGPLLAWLVGVLPLQQRFLGRCTLLAMVLNIGELLACLTIPFVQHVSPMTVGLLCASAGMLGMRGVFSALRLNPTNSVGPILAMGAVAANIDCLSPVAQASPVVIGHRRTSERGSASMSDDDESAEAELVRLVEATPL
eukprot:TRINITY_DN50744_c0_g1_i1.p1 TRINITY_DN50744_c0_g1~~TRINITY_DN50744_c0_g1_i1.p1  ORF type:complete len:571 (-),score=69.35 TRINITY_DN50744_c0_g1_i1:261-1973(-)